MLHIWYGRPYAHSIALWQWPNLSFANGVLSESYSISVLLSVNTRRLNELIKDNETFHLITFISNESSIHMPLFKSLSEVVAPFGFYCQDLCLKREKKSNWHSCSCSVWLIIWYEAFQILLHHLRYPLRYLSDRLRVKDMLVMISNFSSVYYLKGFNGIA